MRTAATVVIVIALFAGVFLGSQGVMYLTKPLSPEELQARIETDVKNLKPTLPQKVHPIVTWFDVEAGQHTIIYKYQVHVPRSVLMSKRTEMEQQMKGSFTSFAVSMMLPRGAKAQAALYDDDKRYAYTIDVTD
jgi:hypothetical protein